LVRLTAGSHDFVIGGCTGEEDEVRGSPKPFGGACFRSGLGGGWAFGDVLSVNGEAFGGEPR
ncbi:MAG: hypothetical protein CVU63_05810, partial [Deltaproteobacteria bacterium HGW-Deltaproteobacteria-20]